VNGTNDKEAIRQFLEEQFGTVVEGQGAVSIVGLTHHAHSGDVLLHAMSAKGGGPHWGKPEPMAEVIDAISVRHARGIAGSGSPAQQFQLSVCRGDSGKPVAFLPFVRLGAPSIVGANGSLATESANGVGAQAQGMRLLEVLCQGAFASLGGLHSSQQSAIESRDRRIAELEGENRALFVALRQELERSVQLSHERKMRELEFMRTTEERRRIIKILPALANVMTGKEVFPISAEDTALIESLCENVSQEEIQMLTTVIGQRSPELSALMLTRFRSIQEKKIKEAEEIQAIAREATGRTYEEAERDAMGQPTKALGE